MKMTEWAENEVDIVLKEMADRPLEEGEDEEMRQGDLEYAGSCYKSALKAYKSILEDGHTELSFNITASILERLLHEIPLTGIEAEGPYWIKMDGFPGMEMYRCKRKFGLFKDVYPDGRTEYHDNDAARCTEVREDGRETNWGCGKFIRSIMEQMIGHPLVQFPYFGYRHPYKMYRKCYNTVNGEPGSYNAYWLQYLKCPDGTKMPVNRFFIEMRGQPDKELTINEFITFLESEEDRLNEQERETPISFGIEELEALEM